MVELRLDIDSQVLRILGQKALRIGQVCEMPIFVRLQVDKPLGTVAMSRALKFDCKKNFANEPYAKQAARYTSNWNVPLQHRATALARELFVHEGFARAFSRSPEFQREAG